ncbi:hypothetical protein BCR32DRAFT_290122 [Anaeromyces robustus]|jgi:hypothetical protein|uniref:Uncharacterized protein n=1 Tax=Anaeromyces robustus TaxID=1754192 RepID=A0A1Y1XKM7_9FUNG|nr:hypothetical protein BCR32DRAFT_290122 [Anaeromyces robustus]|eukprot:ORX86265.1 hypothetical protein BCR32DRAFT_290122 [Anaeromyces robustus]
MKFVSAILIATVALIGANAKCFEQDNEEFFLLPATSKAKAEDYCIINGGKLAEINDRNQNNAASAVAACSEAGSSSVDVWIKSWNSDSYNNVGILMNVNKESKGFTIHQYFEFFNRKRDEIFEVNEEPVQEAAPTILADESETVSASSLGTVDEEPPAEEPAAEEQAGEEQPAEEQAGEEQPVEEPAAEEPAAEEPVVEEPVVEEPAAEEPVVEEPVVEEPVVEEPVVEEPVVEEPVAEEPAEEVPVEQGYVDDGVGTKYEVLCQVA